MFNVGVSSFFCGCTISLVTYLMELGERLICPGCEEEIWRWFKFRPSNSPLFIICRS